MPGDRKKTVSYVSRTLPKAEKNYPQIEKEAFTIIYTVKKFHQYLYGQHVVLLTDHKPLLGLLSEEKGIPSMAAAQIQRWAITLTAYNYSLKYRPGFQNSNADLFGRYPLKNTNKESSQLTNQVLLTKLLQSPITSKKIVAQHEPALSKVIYS